MFWQLPCLAPLTPLLTLRCVQLPSELGTSRLELSSATSCVQDLVYKFQKEVDEQGRILLVSVVHEWQSS